MIDTERKTLNLIKRLEKHPASNYINAFQTKTDRYWQYYFYITGFIGEYYFAIHSAKPHNGDAQFEVLSYVTDNIEHFKKEFNL